MGKTPRLKNLPKRRSYKNTIRAKTSTRVIRTYSMNDIGVAMEQPKKRKTRKRRIKLTKLIRKPNRKLQRIKSDIQSQPEVQQEQPPQMVLFTNTQQERPRAQPQSHKKEDQNFYYSTPGNLDDTQKTFFEEKGTEEDIELVKALGHYGISLDTDRVKLKQDLKSFENKCGIFGIDSINHYFDKDIVIFTRNENGLLTGVCFVVLVKKTRTIYISLICVPRVHKGVGSMIIQRLKNIADENKLFISLVSVIDPFVIQFYERQGFITKTDISNPYEIEEEPEMTYISNRTPTSTKTV